MDTSCPTRRTSVPATPTTTARSPKAAGKGTKGTGRPAVNSEFYAGYCYKRGKWGHRSTTCRVTVAAIFDE
eukprot:16395721-Heterocapsa_arctica.AAC.1